LVTPAVELSNVICWFEKIILKERKHIDKMFEENETARNQLTKKRRQNVLYLNLIIL
jgi:hypothetical protein